MNFEWTPIAWVLPFSSFSATLHVPEGCRETYAKADVWKLFNIKADIPTGMDNLHTKVATPKVFSLTGQSKPKATKGINIIDGKKILIR